ncbi:Interferon-induced GTP-binding protein Mx2 [Heterocephalus glaber]|uniref:Interferon-induced GTP-binding protein Mx2 n=1 Tax=Heterocephalus glaber TaxID=10181 RepID=G5BM65_HETGA|nr:Interferon-induced GTP-binding protein Mx2 [Heterocephalus glaber]
MSPRSTSSLLSLHLGRGKVTIHMLEETQERDVDKNFIAGDGLRIKDKLISLEISSPSIPDLTLIDLLGITRVAVGNQPTDISCQCHFSQIKRLIMKYIEKAENFNLVVVPSNIDIATTEALSMMQEVDPEGDRTIGEEQDLIEGPGSAYTWVGTCMQREEQLRALLEDGKATVPCLAERLSAELITYICKSLPLLENQIKDCQKEIAEELQKYGMHIPQDETKKTIFLIEEFHNHISTHMPLIIQYYVLQMFGWQLQYAMLQLLQDKEACA